MIRQLSDERGASTSPHVLIIVQNLPVPFDRRVWLECRALKEAGYEVTVVCPRAPGDPPFQEIEGVALFKYRPFTATKARASFLAEYAWSFVATAVCVARAWRRSRFDVLQACNPPDIFWPLALAFKLLGCRFVFDHHDLCPELYESRFPGASRVPYLGLIWLERRTFKAADHVISTNSSYRQIAMERGGRAPDEVSVVRTGPDADRLRRGMPDDSLRRGRRYLVAYIGVMGPQDGVDIVLRVADKIAHDWERDDVGFVLMGSGDSYDELLALRDDLDLEGVVEMTGRVPDEVVWRVLSTADLGLSPDPKNPLNDLSTMNKTMEYMAFTLPVVAFDLRETRVSAGESAVYATPNDVTNFASVLVELLEDEDRRRKMGALARARVENELSWAHQRDVYVGVYDTLLGLDSRAHDTESSSMAS